MLSTKLPADPLRKDSGMDLAATTSDSSLKHTTSPHHHHHLPMDRKNKITTFNAGRDGLRIPPPTSAPALSSRMTTKLLERKCQNHIEALNSREFYENGAIWFDKTDDWRAEIGFLSDKAQDLNQHVAAWQKLARRYPEYGIHTMDMSTSIGEDGGVAETTANVEIVGMPTGTVLRSTCVATFESVEGKWLATKFRTISG